MGVEKSTVHRKKTAPWYDSESACIVVALSMFLVFWFSLLGVLEAFDTVEYIDFVWVPALLMVMSGGVIASTIFRMIRRYTSEEKSVYLMDFRRDHIE
jgi:hypothetical protein